MNSKVLGQYVEQYNALYESLQNIFSKPMLDNVMHAIALAPKEAEALLMDRLRHMEWHGMWKYYDSRRMELSMRLEITGHNNEVDLLTYMYEQVYIHINDASSSLEHKYIEIDDIYKKRSNLCIKQLRILQAKHHLIHTLYPLDLCFNSMTRYCAPQRLPYVKFRARKLSKQDMSNILALSPGEKYTCWEAQPSLLKFIRTQALGWNWR